MTETIVDQDIDLSDLDSLDGRSHAWCKRCYPEWAARPHGMPLGVPFTAWCGIRAVILVRNPSDVLPADSCTVCADPAVPCAACGLM